MEKQHRGEYNQPFIRPVFMLVSENNAESNSVLRQHMASIQFAFMALHFWSGNLGQGGFAFLLTPTTVVKELKWTTRKYRTRCSSKLVHYYFICFTNTNRTGCPSPFTINSVLMCHSEFPRHDVQFR